MLLAANSSYSQINCVSGESVRYSINNFISNTELVHNLSFTVKSSNPTVFYIDSIKINDNIIMELQRDYSDISCNADMLNQNAIDLVIYGTGLSGNDSTEILTLADIKYNDNTMENIEIRVKSKDPHINLNYAKLAQISDIYPCPVGNGQQLNIDYVIDITSDVKIYLANELGKMIEIYEIPNVEKGKRNLQVDIDNRLGSGAYWIMLETNSGNHSQSFSIVK